MKKGINRFYRLFFLSTCEEFKLAKEKDEYYIFVRLAGSELNDWYACGDLNE